MDSGTKNAPALELHDVTVTVRDGRETLDILEGAYLEIAEGETVVLTGASGSGKSTLIAVAGLLLRPTAGTVSIGGQDVTSFTNAQRTRIRSEQIGIVYQSSNLFPSLTALQQVELVAHIAGRLDGAARRRATDLLVEVGLESKLHVRPAELSGGERQRVGIARALMNRPGLILADEPTASLDAARGKAITELLLTQAHRDKAAVLLVTHAPEQVAVADRRITIVGGRLDLTP